MFYHLITKYSQYKCCNYETRGVKGLNTQEKDFLEIVKTNRPALLVLLRELGLLDEFLSAENETN